MTDNKQFEINLTIPYLNLPAQMKLKVILMYTVSFISHLGIEELFMDNLSKSKKMNWYWNGMLKDFRDQQS